jgi:hypothetical protein
MGLSILLCALALMAIPLILSVVVLVSKKVRSDAAGLFTKQRLLSWLGIASWFPAFLMIVLALFALSNSDLFITLATFLFILSYAFSVSSIITLYVRKPKGGPQASPPALGTDSKSL